MKRACKVAVSVWTAAYCLSWSLRLSAEPRRLSVALDYQAPAACEAPAAFWHALTQRTSRVSEAPRAAAQILLRVTLRPSSRGFVGQLQIVQDGFATEPRYVEANDCKQVLDALALTAALGIDPDALTQPPDEPVRQAPPENTPLELPAPQIPTLPWHWDPSLQVGLGVSEPVDVRPSFGGSLSIAWHAQRPGAWEPSIELGITVLSSVLGGQADPATFWLTAGTLHLCPLRGSRGDLVLRACAAAQVGSLLAEGKNLTNPERTSSFWSTIGPGLQLQYALSEAFALRLEVAAQFALNPQRYFTAGPAWTAQTPWAIPAFGLAFSYLL